MKNRKTILIAFLVCACLVVSVGYAVLNDDLVVKGTGKLSNAVADKEFEKDIYFDSVISRTNCTAVIDASDTDNDTIVVTIDDTTSKLAVDGDKATVVIKVANATPDVATVTVSAPTNGVDKYFEISCDSFEIPAGTENGEDLTPGFAEITVTIELLKSITADMATAEEFILNLTAVSGS